MNTDPPLHRRLASEAAADLPLHAPWERLGSRPRSTAVTHQGNPVWAMPALLGLLATTAVLYLWDLGASGWANAFYSAAVQAGTQSWKAALFGSFDASSFITVDKSPAALWVMEISARLFGLSSWSILVPEALAGVATVAIVFFAVRRWFGPAAGLLAGAVVALTPVAALMFRFNNPDALLVLLLTAATYATLRSVEGGRTRWLVLASALVGTAFLAKMLQAFLVVPALGLVYLFAGRPRLGRRIWQLAAAAVTLVVASGWWVAIVELTPAADRPYVGGSQDNSVLELILGYNGFGRLTGNETGSVGGFGLLGSRWGPTGWDRLFTSDFGGQISWLIPAAVILLVAGLWLTRGRPRTDLLRASLLIWGGTLLVGGAVFSFAQGIIHPYYSVALAPSIGALVGTGGALVWWGRARLPWRVVLAAAVAASSVWAFVLLGRSPDWYPLLRAAVIVIGLSAAVLIAVTPVAWRQLSIVALAAGIVAALAGPAAYTLDTVVTPHSGAIPSAGPAVLAGFQGGPGGGFARPGGAGGGPGAFGGQGARFGGGAPPAFAGGRFGGQTATGRPAGGFRGGPGGGTGGSFLNSSQPGAALVKLLQADASSFSWVAATVDANSAAGYQLASDDPIMAIGGFNGTDPAPSLAQFQSYVQAGRIHYFIAGGRGGPGGASGNTADAISSWVESHYTAQTVDGVTIYDLTAAATS